VLSFLHKPKADLVIDLENKSFFPGDTLDVRLYLTPQESFHIRSGTVELICTEVYWRRVTTSTGKTTTTSNRKFRRTLFRAKEKFLGIIDATSGMSLSEAVSFTIPTNVPPTVEGKTASITWGLDAKLDIAKMRDVHTQRIITIKPILMAHAVDDPNQRPPAIIAHDSSGHCDLSLTLYSDTAGAGGTLQGTLEMQVKKEVDVREVRIELEVKEEAGTKSSRTVVDSVPCESGSSFNYGDFRQWPFRFQIPQAPLPTITTSSTKVRWRVKGVMDRKMKQDFEAEKEIQVY